ncbi:MAG: C10 family peptidase [Muribaculaceae bacterium]|nr:C10 family peptidase [Muribaculaceae bacterium]
MKQDLFKRESSGSVRGSHARIMSKSLRGILHVVMVFGILILSACSQQELDPIVNDVATGTSANFTIAPEEAVKNAEKYFAALEEGTRGANRSSYRLSVIKPNKTRADKNGNDLPDSLYYLINYDDDRGFALMSADKRLPEMMAISDEGNLDLNDTTYNDGLAYYMKAISNPTMPGNDQPTYTPIINDVYIQGKPLLSAEVSKWSQTSPYNKYCPVNPDTHNNYKTGNIALVLGQIMSYYKHPSSYDSYTFNWNNMVNGKDNDGVAKLLAFIGNESNLATNYRIQYEDILYVARAFYNFRYSYSCFSHYLNEDFPYVELSGGLLPGAKPLLTFGKEVTDNPLKSNYICWVMDHHLKVKATNPNGSYYNKIYVHCVWGRGGKGNGYFFYNFDKNMGGTADYLAPDDSTEEYSLPTYEIAFYWSDYEPQKYYRIFNVIYLIGFLIIC